MRRISANPRAEWQRKVEWAGLVWHSAGQVYWNESAYYEFTAAQIDEIEAATNTLHQLCLTAVQHVIDEKRYAELGIPAIAIPLIERTWNDEPPSLYGRFDLSYDGTNPPRMLEYNADTPTSLLEAAVVQWYWLEEIHPHADQFNSLHDRLIALWKEFQPYVSRSQIHFASLDDREDAMTVAYLADTAQQAGYRTITLPVPRIGWDSERLRFVDEEERHIETIFKLYPWEWMASEAFAGHIALASTQWIEPAWKMVLSNKGILPILWELNPGHPNLLAARFDDPGDFSAWVKKPLLSREGENVEIHAPDISYATGGEYGNDTRWVFQQYAPSRQPDGKYAALGSWVIGQEAAGLGIRESDTPVTGNLSQFVPHLFS